MASAARGRSFLVPIVLFTLVCAAVTCCVLWLTGNPIDQRIWGIISYFMLLSTVLHAWQERSMITDPKGFIRRYLTGLSIKMFLSLIVLVVLLLATAKADRLPIAVTFILLYLAYLGFSTARMAMLIRKVPRA